MLQVAKRDLQYRGLRDDRLASFHYKQEANFLLHRRVRSAADPAEYEMLRQHWDEANRPKYVNKVWSEEQQEALDAISQGISHEDEEAKRASGRWLYIAGAPGSCKSAAILEAAIRAAKSGIHVLVVCPTRCIFDEGIVQ